MAIDRKKTEHSKKGLPEMIIRLHDDGYTEDFALGINPAHCLLTSFGLCQGPEWIISTAGRYFDRSARNYRFLYAIETSFGLKGLLLTSEPV